MDVNRFWRSVFKNILHEIEVIEDWAVLEHIQALYSENLISSWQKKNPEKLSISEGKESSS